MQQFKAPSVVPDDCSTEWHFNDKPVTTPPKGQIGFVYCITNKQTGRQYFGKKLVRFKRTKQKTVILKNGTKKKKKVAEYTESDWQSYYGSNDTLKYDVSNLGESNFFREILVWCASLGEMTYIETWYHFSYNVLLYPSKYYNQWIMSRVSSVHVKRLIDDARKDSERSGAVDVGVAS